MKTNRSSLGLLQVQQATGKKIPRGTDGFNQALAQHMDAKKQTQTSKTTELKQPINGKQSENSKEGEEETYPAYAFTSPFFLYQNENPPAAGLALQPAESGNADSRAWQTSMGQKQDALEQGYLPKAVENLPETAVMESNPQLSAVNQTVSMKPSSELTSAPIGVQATVEKNPSANEGQAEVATVVSALKTKGIYAETSTVDENSAVQATPVTEQQTDPVDDAEATPSPCTESEETKAKAAATAGSGPSPIETETGLSNGLERQLMMPQAIGGSLAIPGEIKTANQAEIVQSIREMMQVQMPQLQNGATAVVKVRLSPEHLGEIEIQITMVDNELDATFVVHSTETKELINKQVLQITESLRQQQLTLANVQVSLATDNQMDFSFFDGFGQSKKEARPQQLKRQTNKRDAPAEAEGDDAVSANGISILA